MLLGLGLELGALEEPVSGRRWSREEVRRRIDRRVAHLVRRGLSPGDRVFLLHGNSLEFFADLLAAWQLGACAVPIDARLTAFELGVLAEATSPALAIAADLDAERAAALSACGAALVETREADTASPDDRPLPPSALTLDADALILFTSGTTGDPKGVVHTHRSLRARWTSLADHLGVDAYRRTLCLLPTHFGHGLICNSLYPWLSGQDLLIAPPFQPELLMKLGELIDEHRVSFLSSVPAVWKLALRLARPPRQGSLRRVFCGSAPLSAHVWQDIREWSGTDQVANAYGITETGSWLAGSTGQLAPADGLIGHPFGGQIRVLSTKSAEAPLTPEQECEPGEPGYVWVNTPALMAGYFGREDLTRQVVNAGWFVTGDIGFRDDRGCLHLRGREREEINKGGMKIYPGDIDAVAERFPKVTDVCSYALPDENYGQNVGLALCVSDDSDATLAELHQWLARHLAEHQLPIRWNLVDEMPRTSRGKINREQVARACAEQEAVDLRRVLAGR